MSNLKMARKTTRGPMLLKSGSTASIAAVVGLVVVVFILTGVSAHGTPTIVKTLEVDGTINGEYEMVVGTTYTDVGSGHNVSNLVYGFWPFTS